MANRGKGSPKKVTANQGYTPSPRDLEIYEAICEGESLREVGEKFSLHWTTVGYIRDQFEKWLAPQIAKRIIGLKVRQTMTLEGIFRDNMNSWKRSLRGDVVETKDGEHGYSKTYPLGDVSYVDRAMKALSEIRAIWNIEKHFEKEGQDALNPAGIPRDEYKLKVAQSRLKEAKELVAELKSQGVKIDA